MFLFTVHVTETDDMILFNIIQYYQKCHLILFNNIIQYYLMLFGIILYHWWVDPTQPASLFTSEMLPRSFTLSQINITQSKHLISTSSCWSVTQSSVLILKKKINKSVWLDRRWVIGGADQYCRINHTERERVPSRFISQDPQIHISPVQVDTLNQTPVINTRWAAWGNLSESACRGPVRRNWLQTSLPLIIKSFWFINIISY